MGAPIRTWAGRGVLVTGASSGIGRALALRAAREGAALALVSRRADALEAVRDEIHAIGARAHVLPCDVADREASAAVIDAAERALGAVDVAFLNAGVGRHRPLIDQELEDAERMVRVNLLGALHFAHPLARVMAARGRGWLVFTASIAGLVPVPGEAVYSATKHAVVGLAEALSIELAPRGVHVLTLCPGAVRTSFVPEDERARVPPVAQATAIEPEAVVEATFRALSRGDDRVIVPARLGAAVAARGLLPSLVRYGTRRATRSILGRS